MARGAPSSSASPPGAGGGCAPDAGARGRAVARPFRRPPPRRARRPGRARAGDAARRRAGGGRVGQGPAAGAQRRWPGGGVLPGPPAHPHTGAADLRRREPRAADPGHRRVDLRPHHGGGQGRRDGGVRRARPGSGRDPAALGPPRRWRSASRPAGPRRAGGGLRPQPLPARRRSGRLLRRGLAGGDAAISSLSAGLVADYAHAPLVLRTADGGTRAATSWRASSTCTRRFAYAFRERLLVSLAVPSPPATAGRTWRRPTGPPSPPASGAALGDVSLGAGCGCSATRVCAVAWARASGCPPVGRAPTPATAGCAGAFVAWGARSAPPWCGRPRRLWPCAGGASCTASSPTTSCRCRARSLRLAASAPAAGPRAGGQPGRRATAAGRAPAGPGAAVGALPARRAAVRGALGRTGPRSVERLARGAAAGQRGLRPGRGRPIGRPPPSAIWPSAHRPTSGRRRPRPPLRRSRRRRHRRPDDALSARAGAAAATSPGPTAAPAWCA